MSIEFYNRNWRMPNSWTGTEDNNTKFSNYSMSFDGSESIEIPKNDGLSFVNTDFSISIWLNPNVSHNGLVFMNYASNKGYGVFYNSGNLRFRAYPTGWQTLTTINTNEWTHILIVGDDTGNNLLCYKNGVEVYNSSYTLAIVESTDNVYIGSQNGSAFFFNGKIDHLSIFDYTLSQAQVTQLYGSSSTGVGNPMAITNGRKPIAYYPIGDYSAYNGTEYLVANSAVSDYVFSFSSSNIEATKLGLTTAISVSAWVKTTTTSGTRIILNEDDWGSNRNWHLYIAGSNKVLFRVYGLSGQIAFIIRATAGEITDGNWHNVCATWDGTTNTNGIQLSIDNDIETATATGTGINTDNIDLAIGSASNSSSTNSLSGNISNVAIFNTALPATGTESIESLYNYGTPPDISSYSGLQGFWKLDASATFDGSNWSIPDDSSNSNTGTSSGMTASNLVQSNLNILSPYSRYALNFDSTDDYINLSSSSLASSLNGLTQFTLSLWYNQDAISNKFLFDFKDGTNRIALQLVNASTNFLYFNSSYNAYSASDTPIQQWNNFILVFDGSQANVDRIKVYINNSRITASTTGTIDSALGSFGASSIFNLGGSHAATQTFNGSISNLSLWNTALNPTEIYNNGLPSNLKNHSSYSNLVSWWQLGENSSFNTNWTVIDEKGTNNGTSVNMAEDDLVNGVGTTGNGVSSGMGGADNILGEAPYSTSNALSYGMGADAKSTSVPS